jgi:hypothetical protein
VYPYENFFYLFLPLFKARLINELKPKILLMVTFQGLDLNFKLGILE